MSAFFPALVRALRRITASASAFLRGLEDVVTRYERASAPPAPTPAPSAKRPVTPPAEVRDGDTLTAEETRAYLRSIGWGEDQIGRALRPIPAPDPDAS